MNKYIVTINHVTYEIKKKDTIENICKSIGITIPTIHLGKEDISKVEVNTDKYLVDARTYFIENNMIINTNSIKVRRYIRRTINKLHNSLKISCDKCLVINCPLKNEFKKYSLELNKVCDFKLCNYYKQGIKSEILFEQEHHESLQEILKDKSIHKVAVVDDALTSKIDEIYEKGFNEVITKDFGKKLKMVEECARVLNLISKSLDGDENALPYVIVENKEDLSKLPEQIKNNVLYKDSLYDIYDKVFKNVINSSKVKVIYISKNCYQETKNRTVVTFDYLMKLEDVENQKHDNITKILKLDNNKVNYNSFINYFIDIMKSKDVLTKDIYQTDYVNIKVKNKTFKIANYNYSKELDSDIILVLEKDKKEIAASFIKDVDINSIYKNYLKEPGNL